MTISTIPTGGIAPVARSIDHSTTAKSAVSSSPIERTSRLQNKTEDSSVTRLRSANEEYLKTLNLINQLTKANGISEASNIFEGALKIDSNGNNNSEASSDLDLLIIEGTFGDDFITAHGNTRIDSGSGDDIIHAYGETRIDSGSGRNIVHAHGQATIKGGDDQDFIHAYGQSEINAGAGDDYIGVVGQSIINAGSGNDHVAVYGLATVDAGSGDDDISIYGSGTTLIFDQGSGRDSIHIQGDINIELGASFSIDDLQLSKFGRSAQISFSGFDDELSFFIGGDELTATLKFADGESLDISLAVNEEEVKQYRIDPKYIRHINSSVSSGAVDKVI